MSRSTDTLKNPLFLSALVLLILNDHLFKPIFHNAVTGKLSDFAGLFIFPAFWSYFFPKHKKVIYIFTALFFIYWKSEYATAFIEFMNNVHIPIARVVDYTDLIALIILPLSYYYFSRPEKDFKVATWGVSIVSVVAFCATSPPQNYAPCDTQFYLGKHYTVKMTPEEIMKELDNLGLQFKVDSISNVTYEYNLNTDSSCTKDTISYYKRKHPYFVINDFISQGDTINKIYLYYYPLSIDNEINDEKAETILTISGFNINSLPITKENIKLYKDVRKRMNKLIKEQIVQPIKKSK